MNFFQRAKLFFGQGFDDYIQRFLTGEDAPDINHPGQVDSQTAMKYTAVFACVRVLSETLAGTPVMLYRKKENGDRETRNDLAVYDILHNQPNEEMSPFNYKEVVMVALNLGGNSVSQKLVNKYGELIGLYPYEWAKVNITRDPTTPFIVRGHSIMCPQIRRSVQWYSKYKHDNIYLISKCFMNNCKVRKDVKENVRDA